MGDSTSPITRANLTTKQKEAANIWDDIDDVMEVLTLARQGKWSWYSNPECKYIGLRIDMRDGHCILTNSEGKRIGLEELRYQSSHRTTGMTWAAAKAMMGSVLSTWQQERIRATKD